MIKTQNGKMVEIIENKELSERIYKQIQKRNGHCPCVPEENDDTVCPCKELRMYGICHCGLYKEILLG